MAKPQESYPESATLGAEKAATNGEGQSAIEAALAEHGEDLAGAIEGMDDLEGVVETAIIVAASANNEEVEHITDSTANLVEALDGLTTEEAATLATALGDTADDVADSLETVVRIQQEGHLDDLVRIATAFADALSPEEVEELATTLETNGTDLVEALDVVLELQREDHLEDLVALATTLSTLEIDEDTVTGLNTVLAAVGEAERHSEPVGLLGALGALRTPDARAGLGYLVAILKAQGRRLRGR